MTFVNLKQIRFWLNIICLYVLFSDRLAETIKEELNIEDYLFP